MLGPRSMGEGHDLSKPLQPRHSTRQLISRYESMSSSSDPVPASGPSLDAPAKASFPGSLKEKSPIRQSFRNLFSVLKKVNLRKGKKVERPLSSFRRQHHPTLEDHPGLNAPPVLRSRSRKLISPLLYLSRTPQLLSYFSDLKPVWTSCTATLEPDTIVIVGRTPQGNPSVQIIELSNCTDVRSLSLQQLDPDESALLPRKGDNDEFKVFEILFEGRPREKFAANSVQERAGWDSAVWDTILPSQDQDCNQTAAVSGNLEPPTGLGDQQPLPVIPVLDVPSFSQRALPAIPMDSRPSTSTTSTLGTKSRTSSCSPSIYPATRPVSRTSSGVDSRSASPSIANLSQLSVVRQRLAQIETTSSQQSGAGLPSPTSSATSIGTRLTTPALGSEMKPAVLQSMVRDRSSQSSAADSILDSYGDIPPKLAEPTLLPPLPALIAELETGAARTQQPRSTRRRTRRAQSTLSCGLEPVIELLQDQLTKSYDQTANLGDQVLSLQNEVQRLPSAIASSVNAEGHTSTVLKMVARLEEQSRTSGQMLGSIDSKLDRFAANSRRCGSNVDENVKLTNAIQDLRTDVMGDLTRIRAVLGSKHDTSSLIEMKNVTPTTERPQFDVDLSRLHSRFDELLAALPAEHTSPATGAQVKETLRKIVSLVEKDSERQGIQAQQQSETVRYLTELNSWIEALVSHDAHQKHKLSTVVDELERDVNGEDGGSTLIADIRQIAQDTVARDQSSAALQASVNGLSALMNENAVESSVARIAALIEHQRRYQEDLVRALGAEISDEIKGERLRFVEAMKEATAINVQIHVEQFKQELKREVVEMTEEVGRLHQDRQAMQNQIADLFAFYRKQKVAAEHDQPAYVTQGHLRQVQGGRTDHRPLPPPSR
ncbi:hypothetical protein DXG01_005017 [Tephrocybe rancida]|nr:hypothetical protein DXG01_005017 [Tephrocybe rancida]